MIKIERYCSCGERLKASASDDDDARKKLMDWYKEHTGREDDGTTHERIKRAPYWRMIRKAQADLRKSA